MNASGRSPTVKGVTASTTMTKRDTRKRIVSLSVVAVSALVLGGACAIVAKVDRQRESARVAPKPFVQEPPLALTTTPLHPPIAGLVPAPRPVRRVVLRRSRAS